MWVSRSLGTYEGTYLPTYLGTYIRDCGTVPQPLKEKGYSLSKNLALQRANIVGYDGKYGRWVPDHGVTEDEEATLVRNFRYEVSRQARFYQNYPI